MIEPSFVFIIGAARSGTKYLRDTLAAAESIAAIPYDINYVWRRGNEHVAHDELDPNCINMKYAMNIRSELVKQAVSHHYLSSPIILEKTVSNTLRIPFINKIVPGAKYILLIRDGRQVIESSYRCWQEGVKVGYMLRKIRAFPIRDWRYAMQIMTDLFTKTNAKNPRRMWGPIYLGMEEDLKNEPLEVVVARQWRYCVERSLEGFREIPSDNVFLIRYEDLTSSPEWIPILLQFVGVEHRLSNNVIKQYKATLQEPVRNQWRSTFTNEQQERIWNEIEETMMRIGYNRDVD